MIDARRVLKGAIDNRTEDKEQAERALAHFDSQSDLFTQCPNCKVSLTGPLATIMSHKCDFSDLIGVSA